MECLTCPSIYISLLGVVGQPDFLPSVWSLVTKSKHSFIHHFFLILIEYTINVIQYTHTKLYEHIMLVRIKGSNNCLVNCGNISLYSIYTMFHRCCLIILSVSFKGPMTFHLLTYSLILCLQNMHPTNPFCAGIQGVKQAYQHAIRTVSLWGPTNFAPVINHVAKWVHSDRDLYELSLKGVIWYSSVLLLVASHVGDMGLQLQLRGSSCM